MKPGTAILYGIVNAHGALPIPFIAKSARGAWQKHRATFPLWGTIKERRRVGFRCRRLKVTFKAENT